MNEISQLDESLLLKEYANLSNDVIFAFHPHNNHLLFLSAAFEKVWNLPRETINTNFTELVKTVHPDDQSLLDNAFTTIQQTKQIQQLEMRLQLADQKEKWVSVDAYLWSNNGIDTIIGTVTDISDYKEFCNTIYKFINKKNAILDILSHDLLNPIGNIQASAKLLMQHTAGATDELVSKILNLIVDNSERCVKMIRDLINKEMRENSEVPLIMQRSDIVERIGEVIEQYKSPYHTIKRHIELVSTAPNLYVTIDEAKFIQVINNLLSNALKFTRDTDEIKVFIEDQETTVLIKVQDTGIGIPQDLQPFIFDKFTKASRPGIKGEPTHGLGLSIIKNIVEWHRGRIWFESTEGAGTTFYVEIPKDKA